MTYTLDVRQVQAPLKDPRHCAVAPVGFPDAVIRAGFHPAAGGAGDTPCSGDILAAAPAICEESTLRSVAANMGVDRDVPVGATGVDLRSWVKVREGVDSERAKRLLASAERYCSTLQTLWNGVDVKTDFQLE